MVMQMDIKIKTNGDSAVLYVDGKVSARFADLGDDGVLINPPHKGIDYKGIIGNCDKTLIAVSCKNFDYRALGNNIYFRFKMCGDTIRDLYLFTR